MHSGSCAGYASGSRHQAAMLIQNSLHSGPSAMARVGSAGTRPEPNNYGSNRLGGSEAQLAACRVSMRGEPRRGGAGALATGRVARAAVEWVQGAVARPCRRGDAHLRQLGTEYLTSSRNKSEVDSATALHTKAVVVRVFCSGMVNLEARLTSTLSRGESVTGPPASR